MIPQEAAFAGDFTEPLSANRTLSASGMFESKRVADLEPLGLKYTYTYIYIYIHTCIYIYNISLNCIKRNCGSILHHSPTWPQEPVASGCPRCGRSLAGRALVRSPERLWWQGL